MNDVKPQPPEVNPSYFGDFNRACKSLDARCRITREKPSLTLLSSQMAIRAAVMSIASTRREITSMRAILSNFLDIGGWPDGVHVTSWMEDAKPEDVSEVSIEMRRTAEATVQEGRILLNAMVDTMMHGGYPGSEEDISRALSGALPQRPRERSRERKGLQPITESDMSRIDMQLLSCPHEDGLKSLSRTRTNIKAMLRIFSRSIWLTGMRPIEMFECRMMIGDRDRVYSDHERRFIAQRPTDAVDHHLLVTQETLTPTDWPHFGTAVREATNITGVDPVILIRNAKTTNANKDLVRTWRGQVLSNIDDEDLSVLCLAAHLHSMDVPKTRRKNIISTMTKNLVRVVDETIPERVSPINLYAFRHDFATRARSRMGIHEVAAMMGHTGRPSTQAYGRVRTRKSGSGASGWMPKCDQKIASDIQHAWGMKGDDLLPGDPVSHEPGMN